MTWNNNLGHVTFEKNTNIVENMNSNPISTKLFIWSGNRRSEERDEFGTVLQKAFRTGQEINSIPYFHSCDHLGSTREFTDGSGDIQAQYYFDPFGNASLTIENQRPDFQFAGYYSHARSNLNLTCKRTYIPKVGRWLNRDPIQENGGINLFAYVLNEPTENIDPLGTQSATMQATALGQSLAAMLAALANNNNSTPIVPPIHPTSPIDRPLDEGALQDAVNADGLHQGVDESRDPGGCCVRIYFMELQTLGPIRAFTNLKKCLKKFGYNWDHIWNRYHDNIMHQDLKNKFELEKLKNFQRIKDLENFMRNFPKL